MYSFNNSGIDCVWVCLSVVVELGWRGNVVAFEKAKWGHYWHHQLSWGLQKKYQRSVKHTHRSVCHSSDWWALCHFRPHIHTHAGERKSHSHCHWKCVINSQKHKGGKKMTQCRKKNKRQREEGEILCLCYDGLENIQESSAGVHQVKWKNKECVIVMEWGASWGLKANCGDRWNIACISILCQKCNCSERWLNIMHQVNVCTVKSQTDMLIFSLSLSTPQQCATYDW